MAIRASRLRSVCRAGLLAGTAIGALAHPLLAQEVTPAQIEALVRKLEALERRQAEQQQQIEAQQKIIERQKRELEARSRLAEPLPPPTRTVVPANVVTGGDKPGSFKLPGTDTSIKLGGYVKGDLIYDVGVDTGDSFAASAIPADGTDDAKRKGKFRAHARQTRFNITTWTPTDLGEVKTFVEGDFFGGGGNQRFSNSTSFRIRHAYGQVGPVLIGQTWSLFMDLDAYPTTVDFFGPAGIPFIRQGQLRYTYRIGDTWSLAASLENPEFTGRDAAGNSVGSDGGDLKIGLDGLPDFVAAVRYAKDGWSAQIAGLARSLELDSPGFHDNAFGWGVHASAVVPTFGEDSAQLNFTYGSGVGRYLVNGSGQDAFVQADGDLELIDSWGVALGYTRQWSREWQTNLVYGHYELQDTFAADDTETLDTIHLNLIWQPSDRFRYGLEYIYGRRGFEDGGLDNDAHRIQFAGQFFF